MDTPLHNYDVGYGSYEDSEYTQWTHTTKFTNEQLMSYVEQALFCALQAVEKDQDYTSEDAHYVNISSLMRTDAFKASFSAAGFRPIKFDASFGCMGWASAIDPGDWKDDTSDRQREMALRLYNRCVVEGMTKVIGMIGK